MIKAGQNEKIYPVAKLAAIVNSLATEGVPATAALHGVDMSESAMFMPATRVSLNQILEGCLNATRLAHDPHCAYRTGLRFHVSTYGMYGFAILSSMNFRQTMYFAVKYHELAAPLAEISFSEEQGCGVWRIVPVAHPRVDAALF